MRRRRLPIRTAFTIIELLVAMTATSMMLFVVSWLFFNTSQAVREGTALTDITATSRTVSEEVDRDAQAMTAPGTPGGFIIIINQRMPNVPVLTRNGQTTREQMGVDSGLPVPLVRSDQLIFIRNASGLEAITPGQRNGFPNGATAAYARVWYGHVRKTNADGTVDTEAAVDDLGQPGPNEIATNWVLGRQALLLGGTAVAGPSPVHVQGSWNNRFVTGYGTDPTITIATPAIFHALSDVSNDSLSANINGPGFYLSVAANNDQYKAWSMNFTFAPGDGKQRLRVNHLPEGVGFESWRVAQMHPFLAANVSDFVVQFAADVSDDPAIAGFPDNTPDVDGLNRLIWYDIDNPPPPADWNNYPVADRSPYMPIGGGVNETRWVFRHDYGDNWPYLIRIKYRIHDPNGRFTEPVYYAGPNDTNDESGKWFEQIIKVNRP